MNETIGISVEVKPGSAIATLEQARDEARRRRALGETGPIKVRVHPGAYRLSRTFVLDVRDSHSTYEAAGDEKPTLTGGVAVGGFAPYRGRILRADLRKQGLGDANFEQLFYRGRRQIPARYPNFDAGDPYAGGWAYTDGEPIPMNQDIEGEPQNRFVIRPEDLRVWARPREAMVFVFPRYNWWNNRLRIQSIDPATREVITADNASFPIRPGDRYYFYNVLEELDAPGEWYLDRATSTLYFYPPDGKSFSGEVVVPALSSVVKVDGADHVTFRGFTIEVCDGAGVEFHECEDCRLIGSVVRHTAGIGVDVRGGRRCSVIGDDIHEVGSHGVSLAGGDRDTLTPADHCADNNYIHHTGVFYKQGVGVSLQGVGNRASHNLIHDCPRFGVLYGGNDQIIECNEIRHVSLETADTGAVYSGGRDWLSPRGSVVRYNYIHDVFGFGREHHDHGDWVSPHYGWGIYLDDNSAEVAVYGNIVVRAPNGLAHLHCARDNTIENNVFVEGFHQQIEMNGWKDYSRWIGRMSPAYRKYVNRLEWKKYPGLQRDGPPETAIPMGGNRIRRNIFFYSDPNARLYAYRTCAADFLKDFECDLNLVWHGGEPLLIGGLERILPAQQWDRWREMGWDRHSIIADPAFVDASADDFRLTPGSPAFGIGFTPIPVDRIGPYGAAERASWPIMEAEGAREHGYARAVPGLHRRR